MEKRGSGSISVDASGELDLQCALMLGAAATPATLRCAGSVTADGDDVLLLRCASITLTLSADVAGEEAAALVAACAEATGCGFERAPDEWVVTPPLPTRWLLQMYLDQARVAANCLQPSPYTRTPHIASARVMLPSTLFAVGCCAGLPHCQRARRRWAAAAQPARMPAGIPV